MNDIHCSSRIPIRKLLKPPIEAQPEFVEHLSETFDMFQVLKTPSIDQAIALSLLEHMLRPTMFTSERLQLLPRLPTLAQQLLHETLESERLSLNIYDCLKLGLNEAYLEGVSELPHVIKVFRIDDIYLFSDQIIKDYENPAPISYILAGSEFQTILYTPTMTFIDGFDPNTGDYKPSIVPALFLNKARKTMFSSSKRKPKTRVTQLLFGQEKNPEHSGLTDTSLACKGNIELAEQSRPIVPGLALGANGRGCCAGSCRTF